MRTHNLAPNSLVNEQGEDTKKHNTATTSREAYKAVSASGQTHREKQKVLETIKQYQPVTSRSISNLTGIERTNITRSLFDLIHDSPVLIKVAYIDKCKITNKMVQYYALVDYPQIQLF